MASFRIESIARASAADALTRRLVSRARSTAWFMVRGPSIRGSGCAAPWGAVQVSTIVATTTPVQRRMSRSVACIFALLMSLDVERELRRRRPAASGRHVDLGGPRTRHAEVHRGLVQARIPARAGRHIRAWHALHPRDYVDGGIRYGRSCCVRHPDKESCLTYAGARGDRGEIDLQAASPALRSLRPPVILGLPRNTLRRGLRIGYLTLRVSACFAS